MNDRFFSIWVVLWWVHYKWLYRLLRFCIITSAILSISSKLFQYRNTAQACSNGTRKCHVLSSHLYILCFSRLTQQMYFCTRGFLFSSWIYIINIYRENLLYCEVCLAKSQRLYLQLSGIFSWCLFYKKRKH